MSPASATHAPAVDAWVQPAPGVDPPRRRGHPARPFATVLLALLAGVATPGATRSDAAAIDATKLFAAADALRSGPCAAPGAARPPLRRRAALDRAARAFADGLPLGEALQRSGYVATQSAGLQMRGARDADELRGLLQRQFCSPLASEGLTEAGAWVRDDRAWLVLSAAPLPAASGGYNRSSLVSGVAAPDPATGRDEVLALVNAARAAPRRCGERGFAASPPLRPSPALERVAEEHARDMARRGYFDHTGADGSTPQQRIDRGGYAWTVSGENLALGRMSSREAVDGWLASPGHCANIMDPRFVETGIALVAGRERDRPTYWVQTFAAPKLR